MNYDEAFKIGSVCDGFVKCTYTELFDTKNGYKFAFQKANIIDHKITNLDAAGVVISYEFPLFVCDEFVSGDKANRFIPVRLTDECITYLIDKLSKPYKEHPLIESIKNNEIFYVKACAVDWRPTNITNVTVIGASGKEILLSDALEDARKRMENAKNLLIASPSTLLF